MKATFGDIKHRGKKLRALLLKKFDKYRREKEEFRWLPRIYHLLAVSSSAVFEY